MSHAKVVTRFAPSPTGFLHIGGARTALFNYYFAKHNDGEFRLRIEDTDKKRSTAEATQAILNGMNWLGIHHDNDIVYQSQNEARHKEIAATLIETGHAYLCYLSPEEQAEERQKSRDEGRAFRSPYRNTDMPAKDDTPSVVRFRVPDGETILDDKVQGQVKWNNKDFDDLILLRADGSPVYMLAVIVDDHDMGVTHVIRGDDHLVNGGRQKLIYQALGWDVPEFAHIPLIFGPDGKKLSKRHGALGVDAYENMGYIPAGLRNYLTRLGWANKDMEVFTDEQVSNVFSLSGINKSPARLDFDKMAFINGQHMAMCDTEDLLKYAHRFLEDKNEGPLEAIQIEQLKNALPHITGRAKTLIELADQLFFIIRPRPVPLTGKTKKSLKPDAEPRLRDLHFLLSAIEQDQWNTGYISDQLDTYTQKEEIGFGKIGPPLRACLTGGAPSPDLALVLELLGKDEALGRIRDCLDIFYNKNTE
ncbi:MAG: glutamate--tRNA ligase [Robiginitomaculum sp.]|nr:MAG: glutamate--tRNA ligase [Robiginitomaculum sp.]